ncbi:Der GTPase-activating protein YihI [Celerinatantimonas sp. YJH-8]|uniref:Der GTPase-activating protein YihI n=1 Tax=Celerinatantimonas sp. YJH-8 TaxID=3228714 RepID=UPI0038C5601D
MAYRKKSRKGGLLAPRKNADFKADRELPVDKVKKGKGKPSGSRQLGTSTDQSGKASRQSANHDRRIGSKKPVQLVAAGSLATQAVIKPSKVKAVEEPTLSKAQQLEQLETDPRLVALLDKADDGLELTLQEQQWLDATLDKISQLMDELGLSEDEDDEDESDENWDHFESDDLEQWLSEDEDDSRK